MREVLININLMLLWLVQIWVVAYLIVKLLRGDK